ncbi:TPA: D-alanyl-D-alanine carboxypeptidase family protein, partial [Streptococcus suis]|nr:D-alanyl-D-alanine carboxypeptidase family protein [Streptococcus suis]
MIMKRTILLCLPTILLLAACHQNTNQANTTKNSSTVVSTTSSQSASITSEQSTSSSTSAETNQEVTSTETQVNFNGYYYSVQGKYGEVIIANKKH